MMRTGFRVTLLGLLLSLGAISSAAAQTVEIEYWQYIFDARVKAMNELIKRFEAANPTIKVKQTTFPFADYETKLIDAAKKTVKRDAAGNMLSAGVTLHMQGQDFHWWREVLVREMGGQPYSDDNTKVTYNSEAGVKALNWYADLQRVHKVGEAGF